MVTDRSGVGMNATERSGSGHQALVFQQVVLGLSPQAPVVHVGNISAVAASHSRGPGMIRSPPASAWV
jgi:hypothetical protein